MFFLNPPTAQKETWFLSSHCCASDSTLGGGRKKLQRWVSPIEVNNSCKKTGAGENLVVKPTESGSGMEAAESSYYSWFWFGFEWW